MNLQFPYAYLRTAVCLGVLIAFLSCCKYQVAISPPWKQGKTSQKIGFVERDFLNQIDQATLEGKPIFIDFYTKWCGPCRIMDRDVFTDGAAGAYFNKHFLNLKIDAEQGEGKLLAKQFGVHAYPTLLFIDKQGKEYKRIVGISSASKLIKTGKETYQTH